jgi:hypothetical protein
MDTRRTGWAHRRRCCGEGRRNIVSIVDDTRFLDRAVVFPVFRILFVVFRIVFVFGRSRRPFVPNAQRRIIQP